MGLDFLRGPVSEPAPRPLPKLSDESEGWRYPVRKAAQKSPPHQPQAECDDAGWQHLERDEADPVVHNFVASTEIVSEVPESSNSVSLKKRQYMQSTLSYGGGSPLVKPAPPPPPVVTPSPSPLKQIPAERVEAKFLEAQRIYITKWLPQFDWLLLDKGDDGCLVCSAVCAASTVPTMHATGGMAAADGTCSQRRCGHTKRAPAITTALIGRRVFWTSWRYGFTDMVKAMCTYQQQQQLMYIHASPWIGISCDESTDRSRGKHLVVFATFMKERAVVTEFLALLTIHKCDGGSLFAVLPSHLDNIGIDLQWIVAISTDGAGVMIGSQSGLVVRLRHRIPHLVGTHCIAHM
ncbi:unnamed protein product [Closterium sp. NIES-54]